MMSSLGRHFSIGLIATLAISISATAADEPAGHNWSYTGTHGPEHWGDLSPGNEACKSGAEQSPIDISRTKGAYMGHVEHKLHQAPARIINNGHTIQVDLTSAGRVRVEGQRFDLAQFHFHHPSEHKVDGRSFDMEIHLVSSSDDHGLAVLGILVMEGSFNPALEQILKLMPKQAGEEQTISGGFDASDFLPGNDSYYRYFGSLTTPPCTENVTWTVYTTPITASQDQIERFAALYAMNARPIQPQNRRIVVQKVN